MNLLYAIALPALDPVSVPPSLVVHPGKRVHVLHEPVPGPPARELSAVLAFGRVLVDLARRCALLPVRYGTTVADEAALAELVSAHEDAWARRLSEIEGRSELLVHLPWAGPQERPDNCSGREYLALRTAEVRRREEMLTGVLELVADRAEETQRLAGADEDRLALLVPDRLVPETTLLLRSWARERSAALQVTGPWPPFSFCGEVEP